MHAVPARNFSIDSSYIRRKISPAIDLTPPTDNLQRLLHRLMSGLLTTVERGKPATECSEIAVNFARRIGARRCYAINCSFDDACPVYAGASLGLAAAIGSSAAVSAEVKGAKFLSRAVGQACIREVIRAVGD